MSRVIWWCISLNCFWPYSSPVYTCSPKTTGLSHFPVEKTNAIAKSCYITLYFRTCFCINFVSSYDKNKNSLKYHVSTSMLGLILFIYLFWNYDMKTFNKLLKIGTWSWFLFKNMVENLKSFYIWICSMIQCYGKYTCFSSLTAYYSGLNSEVYCPNLEVELTSACCLYLHYFFFNSLHKFRWT